MSAYIDIGVFVAALAAIGGGVSCAVSPAWGAVAVGSILLGVVLLSRLPRRGGT